MFSYKFIIKLYNVNVKYATVHISVMDENKVNNCKDQKNTIDNMLQQIIRKLGLSNRYVIEGIYQEIVNKYKVNNGISDNYFKVAIIVAKYKSPDRYVEIDTRPHFYRYNDRRILVPVLCESERAPVQTSTGTYKPYPHALSHTTQQNVTKSSPSTEGKSPSTVTSTMGKPPSPINLTFKVIHLPNPTTAPLITKEKINIIKDKINKHSVEYDKVFNGIFFSVISMFYMIVPKDISIPEAEQSNLYRTIIKIINGEYNLSEIIELEKDNSDAMMLLSILTSYSYSENVINLTIDNKPLQPRYIPTATTDNPQPLSERFKFTLNSLSISKILFPQYLLLTVPKGSLIDLAFIVTATEINVEYFLIGVLCFNSDGNSYETYLYNGSSDKGYGYQFTDKWLTTQEYLNSDYFSLISKNANPQIALYYKKI